MMDFTRSNLVPPRCVLFVVVLLSPALGFGEPVDRIARPPSKSLESPTPEAQALVDLANDNIRQARFEQALVLLTRAYQISRARGDGESIDNVLNSMANVYYATGQLDQAQRYYNELITLDEAVGNNASLAVSLFNLGHVHASQKKYREAEANFRRSLTLSRDLGDENGSAYSLKALGVTAQAQGVLGSAGAYLQQALEIFRRQGNRQQAASVRRHLGDIALEERRPEAAVAHYERALPVLAAGASNEALMRTYRGLSGAYESLRQYEKAFVNYRAYAQLLRQQLEQESRETTRRMQAQFDTERLEGENERLEMQNEGQRKELRYRQTMLRLQYLVLVLGLGILISMALLWLRSRQHSARLQLLATTDGLTGLMNRRAVMQFGQSEWQRYRRSGRPLSCLLLDIDHFKSINDRWGHGVGDEVLKSVSNAAESVLRESDRLGRMGGEEFLVIAPESTVQQATLLAERMRTNIAGLTHEAMGDRTVTVSVGVAQMGEEGSLEELIGHADQALYEAKNGGRDRVQIYPSAGFAEIAVPTAFPPLRRVT